MSPIEHLTEPQRDCLRLVATHHNTKEIAGLLGVSPSAVDKRIERAVQILDARSRFAAARMLVAHEGEQTSDRLPWQVIDVPPGPIDPPDAAADGRGLVRRLFGLSLPGVPPGQVRNRLSALQRLAVVAALTLAVALSTMVVLNMAFTLSRLILEVRRPR